MKTIIASLTILFAAAILPENSYAWEALHDDAITPIFDTSDCNFRLNIKYDNIEYYVNAKSTLHQLEFSNNDDAHVINFPLEYARNDSNVISLNTDLYTHPQSDPLFFANLIGNSEAQSLHFYVNENLVIPGTMRLMFTNIPLDNNGERSTDYKIEFVYSHYRSSRTSDGANIEKADVIQNDRSPQLILERECRPKDLKEAAESLNDSIAKLEVKQNAKLISELNTHDEKINKIITAVTNDLNSQAARAEKLSSQIEGNDKKVSDLLNKISGLEKQNKRTLRLLNKALTKVK